MEKKKYIFWSDHDIRFLIDHYSDMRNEDIGLILNKTKIAIGVKGKKLKLKKNPSHTKQIKSFLNYDDTTTKTN